MEIKFSIFLNFFDVISIFFRSFFDVSFLCFVVLCFVIDPSQGHNVGGTLLQPEFTDSERV